MEKDATSPAVNIPVAYKLGDKNLTFGEFLTHVIETLDARKNDRATEVNS